LGELDWVALDGFGADGAGVTMVWPAGEGAGGLATGNRLAKVTTFGTSGWQG